MIKERQLFKEKGKHLFSNNRTVFVETHKYKVHVVNHNHFLLKLVEIHLYD